MVPDIERDNEFIFRRLFEDVPDYVVGVPVAFALFILLLVVIFRRENRGKTMLWGTLIVGLFAAVQIPLGLLFKPWFSWMVVIVPMVGIALLYVVLMYIRDAQSIHPGWAFFLGILRCSVYAILGFVFLLPGCQSYDRTETHSKVLVLFDVSGSMKNKDDILLPGQDPSTLLTRQDKVVEFLTGVRKDKAGADMAGRNQAGGDQEKIASFLDRLASKSPVAAYRFGKEVDEEAVVHFDNKTPWAPADIKPWLNPDAKDIVAPEGLDPNKLAKFQAKKDLYAALVTGTNVGGSALQMLKAEGNSYIQAVVIFSDGQSNVGSDQSVAEFLSRVNSPSRPINVFTVGVGNYRQPASIQIDDLQAPQVARPDDKFPVRVPVVGTGLTDEEFDVQLELTRAKDYSGNVIKGGQKLVLPVKKGKFQGAGDHPQDVVEFEVDLQKLTGIKAADDKAKELQGEWEIIARVPRHPRESFPDKEHVSNPPTRVLVQDRELRVLLFASGPTREYQFLRTLFYREKLEKRVELTVFLQTAAEGENIDQDVSKERLLTHFPNRLGEDNPADKYSSLNMYDVIIAIDPDWLAVEPESLKLLEKWVDTHAGGLIFIGGPVHTYQLARARPELEPVKTIYPVALKDYRLTPLGLGLGIDTTHPYPLRFLPDAANYDFLKLDETKEDVTEGWNKFFWGDSATPEPGKTPRRGVYSYYPVEKLRADSRVLATFVGPDATRINDGKDEQPYLVLMRVGNGKTVYLGSGETWRLRQFKEAYHERFWIKLARYAASGSQQQKKYGRFLAARKVPVGTIAIEAQIKGANLLPLAEDSKPAVIVKKRGDLDAKPQTFYLRSKPGQGDWQGWFMGNVKLRDPGEYEFQVPIPNTSESLTHVLEVFQPDLEQVNLRENHKALYNLATDAARLPRSIRDQVQPKLLVLSDDLQDGKSTSKLFFPLQSADNILTCIEVLPPKRERTKGVFVDLWDEGLDTGWEVDTFYFALLGPLCLGVLACAILLFLQQYRGALIALAASIVVSGFVLAINMILQPAWEFWPVDFSLVLITVVTLLGVEWLTRKLLRLA